ncbi:hypothetical protein NBH00_12955 [Paraconexibacter antarcticus]|uniref:Uncharacterized protein n=1 Tax=Paraconexibacter antarcticus TaxID=2949664 RepID=A0ABY5DLT1_9ACTN|nr:hypothetical protein [Paraconexibacter antarcticus]UTI62275.1 hypothetical protein NBH00_12955 [Paraconexibacter antarcticus]
MLTAPPIAPRLTPGLVRLLAFACGATVGAKAIFLSAPEVLGQGVDNGAEGCMGRVAGEVTGAVAGLQVGVELPTLRGAP